jgi:hypothetical protein
MDDWYEECMVRMVTTAGPTYDNPIPLGEVAIVALRRGMPIHFIDLSIAHKPSPRSIVNREAHAATQFNQITAPTGRNGCLVLFGAHHLHQKDPTIYRGGDQSLGELLGLGYITFRKDSQPKQQ